MICPAVGKDWIPWITVGRLGRVTFDHAVLDCETALNLSLVSGMADHAFPLKSVGDAMALRFHVIEQLEKAEVCDDPERQRWYLSFVVVGGGAGSLEIKPGVQSVDLPEFPATYKHGALATREALNLLRKEPSLEWSFLSPSADLFPGERTGKFRLGADQLLRDANGESRISVEDYAMAMIDEVETPQHIRRRFTVRY